jgi:hypothetical protein
VPETRAWDNEDVRTHRVVDTHASVERELNEERVAALRRISSTLETLIAQLHGSRERMQHMRGADRRREVEAYRQLRKEAVRYRWYLEVQREALGLRHHQHLDEFYPIPRRVDL